MLDELKMLRMNMRIFDTRRGDKETLSGDVCQI